MRLQNKVTIYHWRRNRNRSRYSGTLCPRGCKGHDYRQKIETNRRHRESD